MIMRIFKVFNIELMIVSHQPVDLYNKSNDPILKQ